MIFAIGFIVLAVGVTTLFILKAMGQVDRDKKNGPVSILFLLLGVLSVLGGWLAMGVSLALFAARWLP
jgi:uncharacterized membrane protein